MSVQSLIMARPALAQRLMSKAPEAFHHKNGLRFAMSSVEAAVKRTAAYPQFLKEHGIDPNDALDPANFGALPLMSKRDYLDRFALNEVCLDGTLTSGYVVERSSGMSGNAYYWLRTPQEDAQLPTYLNFAFKQVLGLKEKPTLAVVCLALGMWTAGEKLAQALRTIAAGGEFPMTVASPGINMEEILETIQDVGGYFDQLLLLGYPPFIKQVVDEGIRRGIDWPSLNVRVALGGEGYSEQWRAHVAAKLGVDASRDLLAVSGAYGAADLGATVGREYPLTVLVRQLCEADEGLTRDLFGGPDIPNLFQYNPSACFIEEVDGELVFTTTSGIPLVRYRIGDAGGLLGFEHVMRVLADHGYDAQERLASLGFDPAWRIPLFYCSGRTDGVVFVGGLNVYPENIATVLAELDDPEILGFKLATAKTDDAFTERLLIMLEHSELQLSERQAERHAERYKPLLVDGLMRVNREYRRLHEASPKMAEPQVRVYASGHGPFAADKGTIKHRYIA